MLSKSRFKNSHVALRFFFRVRELLYAGKASRLRRRELPQSPLRATFSAIDDYRNIGWCMRGLDDAQLWLLSEIYGPHSFGVQRRTYAQADRARRLECPEFGIGRRQMATVHRLALKSVSRRLLELAMIPGEAARVEPRIRRRIRVPERRGGDQAAAQLNR